MTARTLFRSGRLLALAALTLAAVFAYALWARVESDAQPDGTAGARAPTDEVQSRGPGQLPLPPAADDPGSPTSMAEVRKQAPPTPFHASPAQRAADQQRIRDDPNLPLLAQELAERALAGDIDAARALADLLRLCAAATGMGPQSDPHEWRRLALWGDLDGGVVDAMRMQFSAEQGRCAAFGVRDPEEFGGASMHWMQLAAERGDPAAILRHWAPTSPDAAARVAAEQARLQAAVEILREGDPLALARYAPQLGILSGLASEAYVLAACQMIEDCAFDPQAYALQRLSVQSLAGNDGAYLQLRMMTPRQRQIASGQAALILRLWRTGQFELLVAPQPPPPRRPGAR